MWMQEIEGADGGWWAVRPAVAALRSNGEIDELQGGCHARLSCCEDAEREHIKDGDYRTLRNHYAVAHWRRWFERPPAPGQPPRTQKLSKTGAFCQVTLFDEVLI